MLVVLVEADGDLDAQSLCAGVPALEPGSDGSGDDRKDDVVDGDPGPESVADALEVGKRAGGERHRTGWPGAVVERRRARGGPELALNRCPETGRAPPYAGPAPRLKCPCRRPDRCCAATRVV